MPKRLASKHRPAPPFLRSVTLRARSDGWSEARQCRFLAGLYVTGSVTAAARSAGMTPTSVYRLRARKDAESFAAAWERVLIGPGSALCNWAAEDFRKVTNATLVRRLETDLVQPLIHRKRMTAIRQKPDNSALFRLLRRQGAGREWFGPEGDAW